MYYLDESRPRILVVDGVSRLVTATIPVGVASATTLVVNHATNTGYVTAGNGVLVVDLASKTVTTTISLPSAPASRLGMALVP